MKSQIRKPSSGKATYSEEYKQHALKQWRNRGRGAATVASRTAGQPRSSGATPPSYPRSRSTAAMFTPDPVGLAQDPENGWVYDERAHAIRLVGAAREKAFTAKIDVTYEEHR